MKKKWISGITAIALLCSLGMLSGCGGEHEHAFASDWSSDENGHWHAATCEHTEEKADDDAHEDADGDGKCDVCGYELPAAEKTAGELLKEGFFTYAYTVAGYGDMTRFFHFYDGLVYYGQDGGGGTQHFVYSYTLEETPFEYGVWFDKTERDAGKPSDENGFTEPQGLHTGTADYTITLVDMADTSKTCKLGYDGECLYAGDETVSAFVISDAQMMRFDHDTAEDSPLANIEIGQQIMKIQKKDDDTCFVELYHNGVYSDMMDVPFDGTWSSSEAGGATTYTLTPNDAADASAVLVVNADGTGTYTPDGGEAVEMELPAQKELALTLSGPTSSEGVENAEYQLRLYTDMTCELYMVIGSTGVAADAGTFGLATDYSYDFELDLIGTIHSTATGLGTAEAVYTVVIPEGAMEGFTEATLTNAPAAPASGDGWTLTGTHSAGNFPATLVLGGDGTAEYSVEMPEAYGGTQTYTGTWTDGAVTLDLGDAGSLEIALSENGGVMTAENTEQQITLTSAAE